MVKIDKGTAVAHTMDQDAQKAGIGKKRV